MKSQEAPSKGQFQSPPAKAEQKRNRMRTQQQHPKKKQPKQSQKLQTLPTKRKQTHVLAAEQPDSLAHATPVVSAWGLDCRRASLGGCNACCFDILEWGLACESASSE
ncbi:predicted protein [Sclerotinia sclerotiorum 1980 UF-70]|uniref:Uncharacterized protein n=2 Tax=Sclerotinia sclerotiorum (strain ATCC 18683 / 1980 / Ss-1) TaxID=665079 RepID=A0A1D9Q2C5_SCLS1|nr:predicted protein [Sclerotinia sclerotiorum 1980 UF-70]APA09019.1 hypothetical protein sscle_04g037890 [Sclerotinia sclerotiorum 1980 UF-70]EDO00030.1 predicted protein [Sclerotinia sclerotiorum 1980 UF-70]